MTVTLVLLHGRGQEGKKAPDLITKWLDGVNRGLGSQGLRLVTKDDVVLPFYGDILYESTAELAAKKASVVLESVPRADAGPGDDAGPLDPWLGREVGRVEREMIRDMATAAGVPPPREEGFDRLLSWGGARRALAGLARRTKVDQAIIRNHLPDVAVYLVHARDAVLDLVRRELPPDGDLVLVTHSLGTVVARDLLVDDDVRSRTLLWVTAGSPLGLDAVQKNLRKPGHIHPGPTWLTTYDVNDVVSLGHPLRPSYGAPLDDVKVENGDQPHAIERYLAHPAVAAKIHAAWSAGASG